MSSVRLLNRHRRRYGGLRGGSGLVLVADFRAFPGLVRKEQSEAGGADTLPVWTIFLFFFIGCS